MTFDLGRRLLLSNAVQPGELLHAVFDAVHHHRPFARALADTSSTVRAILVRPLEGGERAPLEEVVPNRELVRALPRGLPARLLAIPIRKDPVGVVEVAVVDPYDRPLAAELAYHLDATVRLVAASLEAIERGVREATIELSEPPTEEAPVPLVRRSGRMSLAPPAPVSSIEQAVDMVLDFSASAREEREAPPQERFPAPATRQSERPSEPAARPSQPPMALSRAKLKPLNLAPIEGAADRDDLLGAIVRALLSTASGAAIFVPRRGAWAGVAGAGSVDVERIRSALVPTEGAVATAVTRGDWCAKLDPTADQSLIEALNLKGNPNMEVLAHPVFVTDKPAMLLVTFGMVAPVEASRRIAEITKATSFALLRILRGR